MAVVDVKGHKFKVVLGERRIAILLVISTVLVCLSLLGVLPFAWYWGLIPIAVPFAALLCVLLTGLLMALINGILIAMMFVFIGISFLGCSLSTIKEPKKVQKNY